MTYQFLKNVSPSNMGDYLFRLKSVLKTAGWTVPRSATGTGGAYSSSSDLLTTANGCNAADAWFVVQMPTVNSVNRQLCFQRGSSTTDIRVKSSYSGGFTGGSPAAGQVPSATDEQLIWGGGTDASPTYTASVGGTIASNRCHFAADNAAPYGFWVGGYPVGGGAPNACFFLDPLGTYAPGDTDPYCKAIMGASHWLMQNLNAATNAMAANLNVATCWFDKAGIGSGPAYLPVSICHFTCSGTASTLSSGGLPCNPVGLADDVLPVIYGRHSSLGTSPTGMKGWSSMMLLRATARNTGDVMSKTTTNDRILIGDFFLPWDGSTPLV